MNLLFNLKEEEQLQKLNKISKEVLLESWDKDLITIDEVIDMAMDIIYKLQADIDEAKEQAKDDEERRIYKDTEDQNYHRRGID